MSPPALTVENVFAMRLISLISRLPGKIATPLDANFAVAAPQQNCFSRIAIIATLKKILFLPRQSRLNRFRLEMTEY